MGKIIASNSKLEDLRWTPYYYYYYYYCRRRSVNWLIVKNENEHVT